MVTEQQFSKLSTLLKEETAVVLGSGKEYLVESRLSWIARQEGFASLSELIEAVLGRSDEALNRRVLLALTTNETSFFRDLVPFELLKTKLLPELIARRASSKTITIWSAGCSTGQEPYSIAMLIRDAFPTLGSWNIKILASDLNPGVLERAKDGVYSSLEVNRGLPARHLVRFFSQVSDCFKIRAEIRSMVEFFEQNLTDLWSVPKVDMLFLRNVLIYFDMVTKQGILERVKNVLVQDGYLFLGNAESPFRIVDGFSKVDGASNIYRLVENPEAKG